MNKDSRSPLGKYRLIIPLFLKLSLYCDQLVILYLGLSVFLGKPVFALSLYGILNLPLIYSRILYGILYILPYLFYCPSEQSHVDDRVPVPSMTKAITGLLFGDKGYIKQELFDALQEKGLKLVTGIRNGMKNKLMTLAEKVLLRKRSIIETVFSVLKNSFEIEHTRHRSIWNAFVHMLSTLLAYSLKTNKPAITYQS